MRKHNYRQAAGGSNVGFDVSSLIDICFLLLIYFIVTSTIMPVERDVNLPGTGETNEKNVPQIDPIHVYVSASGAILSGEGLNRQTLDADLSMRQLPLLEQMLELYKQAANASGDSPVVVIHADEEAIQQRVIDVLNALAEVEITKIMFADEELVSE